jgi:hypothetical protein
MAIINRGQLVVQGDPLKLLEEARGRIWRKRVTRDTLADYQGRLPVISVRLSAGDPVVHVWGERAPDEGFAAVEPGLEDVYFHRVGGAAATEG